MQPKRVLVVDDVEALRELAAELLASAGYVVSTASDGESGLDAIERERPDLVLLDLGMPRLDGQSVLDRLRELPAPPAVIVTTGRRGIDFVLPPFVRGTLHKPVSATELETAVARALDPEKWR